MFAPSKDKFIYKGEIFEKFEVSTNGQIRNSKTKKFIKRL